MDSLNDKEKLVKYAAEQSAEQVENIAETVIESANQNLEKIFDTAQKIDDVSQEKEEISVTDTAEISTDSSTKSKKDDETTGERLKIREKTHLFHIREDRTREELVEDLRELLLDPAVENIRVKVEAIKQAFYRKNQHTQVAVTEGAPVERLLDAIEIEFKELLSRYKEIKSVINAKREEQKEKNLKLKRMILDKLEQLTSSSEDLSATIPAFRKLQKEWKKIEQVPQNMITEIWKQYNSYQEKFYDLIKINNDLREYDFKKNLELKTNLCEAVEKLESEANAVSAFQILQKLHDEWREIGPVAREIREDVWNRFKEASAKINQKHQKYFDELKMEEEANLKLKIALCEKIENIDFDKLKSFRQWDEQMAEVFEAQNEWKKIGFASKKANTKIFRRFRNACDTFFKEKSIFFKNTREEITQNITKKKELLAIAETLKESTDWQAASNEFIRLQKEWGRIGFTPRKLTDELWHKFHEAREYFSKQRGENVSNKREKEIENMKLKQNVIEKIKAFVPKGSSTDNVPLLKALIEEFHKIGFVPIKEKKSLIEQFNEETDKKFDEIFDRKSNKSGNNNNRVAKENNALTTMKKELATYQNNIEFLSATSNKGNKLIEELNQKIEKLKSEIDKLANCK
jgi:hypothetical protein